MARNYRQGIFKPVNPKKYRGDPTNIVYRSSWELIAFKWLDSHPSCVSWASEEFFIPYVSPVDDKIHRYFVDLIATFIIRDGTKKTYVIEIKPYEQTIQPKASKGKSKKTLLEQVTTYAINEAKWKAAKAYCDQKGYEFKVIDEYALGIKKRQ
jgi:hypothetical protein